MDLWPTVGIDTIFHMAAILQLRPKPCFNACANACANTCFSLYFNVCPNIRLNICLNLTRRLGNVLLCDVGCY